MSDANSRLRTKARSQSHVPGLGMIVNLLFSSGQEKPNRPICDLRLLRLCGPEDDLHFHVWQTETHSAFIAVPSCLNERGTQNSCALDCGGHAELLPSCSCDSTVLPKRPKRDAWPGLRDRGVGAFCLQRCCERLRGPPPTSRAQKEAAKTNFHLTVMSEATRCCLGQATFTASG